MKKWNLVVVLKFGTLIVAAVLLLMHIFKLWNGALGIFEPMMGVVVMLPKSGLVSSRFSGPKLLMPSASIFLSLK